jgi:hypothetical protein
MQGDVDALRQLSRLVWNSEIWRVVVNIQHRFEQGYEPSDMDFLRLDLRQPLSNPESRIKHRHVGSLWFDTSACGLRLERTGEVVVACGDSSEKVLTQFRGLIGETLARVDVVTPARDADFVLGDGSVLRCFPARSHFGESWGIFSAENDGSPLGPTSTSR